MVATDIFAPHKVVNSSSMRFRKQFIWTIQGIDMMRFETFKAFQTIKTSNSKSKLLISRKTANRNNNNENFCSAKLDRSVAKTTQNPSKSRGSHNLFVLAGAP